MRFLSYHYKTEQGKPSYRIRGKDVMIGFNNDASIVDQSARPPKSLGFTASKCVLPTK